jgi:hypothetical protein
MKKFILLIAVYGIKVGEAQRVVIHNDLIATNTSNTIYKVGMHKLYDSKLNEIKNRREKTLQYATTIEEVQRKIFGSLTNVEGAIRNGKTMIYI